ncbi:MAG TPA: hypothetical protein VGN83_15405 [Falsiroseomonas sp.]|nr:hypothetical protein [Falsiroseomonas sp.]
MNMLGADARAVRAALAGAPDAKLGRIVGMLDSLLDRRTVDELLEPVRGRLRWLRPARPLRFPRLLAMPLEGALVEANAWNRAAEEIPRSAITPLAAAVQRQLGDLAEEVEMRGCGHTVADIALVGQLGTRLWKMAGAVELSAPLPGWREAGLPAEAAAPIIALAGALWRHGAALWDARLAGADGPPEALLRSSLAPLAKEGPAALAAAMALLMHHAEAPARVAAVAASLNPAVAPLAERVLEADLLEHGVALREADALHLVEAASGLERRLADAEAAETPANRDARRRLVARLRREGAEACHARFVQALREAVLEPAERLAAAPRAGDAAVAALEAAARELRRLAAAGRGLGEAGDCAQAVAAAMPRLRLLAAAPGGLGRVEVARLAEILAGPEAALPLLG